MRRSTLPILKTFYWKEGSQMGIIASIVFGLIAGVIANVYAGARWRGISHPDLYSRYRQRSLADGWRRCLVLWQYQRCFNLHSFPAAVVGAIVVLVIFPPSATRLTAANV